MLKHPHAKAVFTEVEALPGAGGAVEIVLVVMTDLELDALNPAYDRIKSDGLIMAVQDFLKVSKVATKASIRTIR